MLQSRESDTFLDTTKVAVLRMYRQPLSQELFKRCLVLFTQPRTRCLKFLIRGIGGKTEMEDGGKVQGSGNIYKASAILFFISCSKNPCVAYETVIPSSR